MLGFTVLFCTIFVMVGVVVLYIGIEDSSPLKIVLGSLMAVIGAVCGPFSTAQYERMTSKPIISTEQYPTIDTLITETTVTFNGNIPETKIDTTYTFNFSKNDIVKFLSE